jgi:hypothetical protein
MLKTIACIVLATTTLMAWTPLASIPEPASAGTGACITYGKDSVWGVFPSTVDSVTYVGRYDISGNAWYLFEDEISTEAMTNTACTFQWPEDGAFFVIGNEDDVPILYSYNLHDGEWYDDDDFPEELCLGAGTCIAYQPNVNYNSQLYPVPGWLYCLPAEGTEFWRYIIPTSLPDQTLNGIFPGNLAVIADKTPKFEWPGSTGSYQLQVATLQSFATKVIDVYVSPSEYQATTALANNTYFWRTRDLNGSGVWGTVHNFQLQAGWNQLTDIDEYVGDGAAMAYDNYDHQAIIAFPGNEEIHFFDYNIASSDWDELGQTPVGQFAGTSLVTSRPAGGSSPTPWAAFGGFGTSDYLRYYRYDQVAWYPWSVPGAPTFPTTLRAGSSMAYGLYDSLFLTVGVDGDGNPRSDFYGQKLPWGDDGPQSSSMQAARGATRIITRNDGISVEYQLCAPAHVCANLHDVTGRLVGTFDAGEQQSGMHRLDLSRDSKAQHLAAGAYFLHLDMGSEQAKLKAVIR